MFRDPFGLDLIKPQNLAPTKDTFPLKKNLKWTAKQKDTEQHKQICTLKDITIVCP